ncbi:MAG: site-specific integrase [Phycisphaerae bacterium]|nr:site-specific integrase [Phycisphaerae bacterium]
MLAACPDHHWRTIVGLRRYGGLRCPSEVLSLRWDDVDWDRGRIRVTSPKTEHLPDRATRVIPMFPELRDILLDSFELASEGDVYVVDQRFRRAAAGAAGWANSNPRTTFAKIVRRAGLTIWPRPFHNMRASLETEWVERFPAQVLTDWMGNTPKITMRHYLMTMDAHFEAAIRGDGVTGSAAQNPAQQLHPDGRNTPQDKNGETKNPANCGVYRRI